MAHRSQRVVIVMNKGLVQDVFSERPLDVTVLDSDVEGLEDDEIQELLVYKEKEEFSVRTRKSDVNPQVTAQVFVSLLIFP